MSNAFTQVKSRDLFTCVVVSEIYSHFTTIDVVFVVVNISTSLTAAIAILSIVIARLQIIRNERVVKWIALETQSVK